MLVSSWTSPVFAQAPEDAAAGDAEGSAEEASPRADTAEAADGCETSGDNHLSDRLALFRAGGCVFERLKESAVVSGSFGAFQTFLGRAARV